jgi:hypothetical protein
MAVPNSKAPFREARDGWTLAVCNHATESREADVQELGNLAQGSHAVAASRCLIGKHLVVITSRERSW